MKLRLGMPVSATDGEFGHVSEIIVDPAKRAVTNIVVKPLQPHQQPRLVPLWIVRQVDGVLHVELDSKHLRQLQRVSESEFVQVEGADLDSKWDVGASVIKRIPMWNLPNSKRLIPESHGGWSPIPKGECEIRRGSNVEGSGGRHLGVVSGFLADEESIAGVIVLAGVPGFRGSYVVPIQSVVGVSSGLIRLSLSLSEFEELERLFDGSEHPGIRDRITTSLLKGKRILGAPFAR